jgi:hypothetical protein
MHFDTKNDHLRELQGTGLMDLRLNPFSKPRGISVMWCVGIYEFEKDRLKICVKYHGQGVEGEAARRWRPPRDFVVRKGQDHILFIFKRDP